jgi:hypothetical protein
MLRIAARIDSCVSHLALFLRSLEDQGRFIRGHSAIMVSACGSVVSALSMQGRRFETTRSVFTPIASDGPDRSSGVPGL